MKIKSLKCHSKTGGGPGVGKVVTVGARGMFKTIQAAITFIETQVNFEPVTLRGMPTQVTSWVQDTSIAETAAIAGNVLNFPGEIWVQVAGESEAYPLEGFNTSGVSGLQLAMNRIAATIATPVNITYLKQRIWEVKILDSEISEDEILINSPIAVNFTGVDTVWSGEESAASEILSKGAGFQFGYIKFGEGLTMINASDRLLQDWTTENCVRFVHDGGTLGISGNDWMSPNVRIGDLTIKNCHLLLQPVIGVGHVFYCIMRGDLKVNNITIDIATNDVGFNNDTRLFDGMVGRNEYIDNVHVTIRDPSDQLIKVSIVGVVIGFEYSSVSNVTATCADVSDVDIFIVDYNSVGIGITPPYTDVVLDINNCHILASKGTGLHKIFNDIDDIDTPNIIVNVDQCTGGDFDTEPVGALHITTLNYLANDRLQVLPDGPNAGILDTDANRGNIVSFQNPISVTNTSFGFQFIQPPRNALTGQEITLFFVQDATGGYNVIPQGVGFYNNTGWGVGAANDHLIVTFRYDGNKWDEVNTPTWVS